MTGRMIVSYFGRESLFACDDLTLSAIERVIREAVTRGNTVYFSATADVESGRAHITTLITPQTYVLFTYTDGSTHEPDDDPRLEGVLGEFRRHIREYGGLTLDADDQLVEPLDV